MAHVAPIYPSFARGEVSPLMFGRIDIEQYPTCLEKCRNAYIRPYGCITRLTGTEFISQTKNSGKVRLLKFVFSPTDSYIIECGAGYFRFYQNGAPVIKNGNIYEISNSYYEDQLDSIQYVQLDDIIKLTCLPHNGNNSTAKPKELIRYASDNWVFRNVTFKDTPYLDQNTTDVTMTASAVTGNDITIQASADYFDSGMVGGFMWIGTPVKDTKTNKDVQGFVKFIQNNANSSTLMHAKVMSKLSGTTATKLWGEGAFSDSKGYPSVVALFDGRLYYARTPVQPRNVYGSKPYAYETFTPAVNNEDDGGINVALATNANGDGSDIKWMIGASYLLCGTYGGEFVIRGTGDGAITPTDISARQRTNWGGEPLQPILAGTFVHLLQRNGNKLRQFQYDFYYDSYKAVDVSIFSEHLLASPIKEMALQKNPDSIIYLMREDGNVVMLTLEQDQSVQAWSLLEDLGAKVESIQTIPSYDGNFDEVYMVMNRDILSTTASYTCNNPSLNITLNYTGTKLVAGTEIVRLSYSSFYDVWMNYALTDSYYTKLSITSSNPDLSYINEYSGTKPDIITETETLQFEEVENNNTMAFTSKYKMGAAGAIPANDRFSCIVYGNNLYVGATEQGRITLSSNGLTGWDNWGSRPSLGLTSGDKWVDITYSSRQSLYVLISSNGYISTSSNGSTWTAATQKFTVLFWSAIAACTNRDEFCAINENGYCTISGLNAINWATPIYSSNLAGHKWVSLTYFDGRYVALSKDGYISRSSNGLTWGRPQLIVGASDFVKIIPYKNKLMIINRGGGIYTFTNENDVEEVYTYSYLNTLSLVKSVTTNNSKVVIADNKGYVINGEYGAWKSLTTENRVDITNSNYGIKLLSLPEINDTLTFTWNTINNYAPLEDYDLIVEGEPNAFDLITLTYDTQATPVRYIERMLNPITADNPINWWYVRSGLKYDGYSITSGNTLTLSANSGTVTATASASIFTSGMVGNRIRLIDNEYNILGEGDITEYTSGTEITLDITTPFIDTVLTGGKWGISTDVLNGLSHLNSQTVQVFADGKEQASKVVDSGSIDIDDAFIAVVGLPYTSYITTMPMEAGSQNGTAVGKRKRISEMAIRVWNTIGVRVGRDFDNLYDTIYEQQEPFTGVIPNIKYNQGWVWDANITVEQSHPYPMNILSIAPIVTEVDK